MSRSEILKRIQNLLASIMPAGASAYVFGSQARGDNTNDSDWDLLILLRGDGILNIEDRGALSMSLYLLGAEMGVEINPVLYTHTEWQQRRFTAFYKNVINDRIKIWG